MTDPAESEEVNEELSTEELKSVSGGFMGNTTMIGARGEDRITPDGSGSGMTRRDYKRSVLNAETTFGDGDGKHE